MICVSKTPDTGKNYWIEEYTEEEKDIFLELGFTEKVHTEIEKRFGINDYLFFKGSSKHGFWDELETEMIDNLICELLDTNNFDIWEAIYD